MKKLKFLLILLFATTLFIYTQLAALQYKAGEVEALHKTIASLEAQNVQLTSTIEAQKQKITELTKELHEAQKTTEAQQTKPPETQKTSRSADRPRYNLTDAERDLVERVVMAESGGESYKGQMLVAQCILNACEIDGIRPAEVIRKYVYAKARPEPSDSVKRAVSAVFDEGEQVTDEPIVYFYAPALVRSEFHESQIFAIEEGGHKFFCRKE